MLEIDRALHGESCTLEVKHGAQMCAWGQQERIELSSLRQRVAAMSERLWNPDAKRSCQDFAARLKTTDSALDKLLVEGG